MNDALVPLAIGAPAPPLEPARWLAPPSRPTDRVLLCFLPLAGAPVCTEDAKALSAAAPQLLAGVDAIVVASVDAAPHLRRFLDQQGGGALHACSDPELALAQRFGVAWPQRFAARASFLLDGCARGAGVVRAAAVHPIAFSRPLDRLASWLARG